MITHEPVIVALRNSKVCEHFDLLAASIIGTNGRWIYSPMRLIHWDIVNRAFRGHRIGYGIDAGRIAGVMEAVVQEAMEL